MMMCRCAKCCMLKCCMLEALPSTLGRSILVKAGAKVHLICRSNFYLSMIVQLFNSIANAFINDFYINVKLYVVLTFFVGS